MSNPIFHSQYTAAQIEAAIGKGPRVNASGYWEVWNVANMAYESTGVGAGVQPPTVVTQVSQMTHHGYIYIYNGSETGYNAGDWYYWNGSAWTDGGAYQVAATDPTLSIAGKAADAKACGELKSAIDTGAYAFDYTDYRQGIFHTGEGVINTHLASCWVVGPIPVKKGDKIYVDCGTLYVNTVVADNNNAVLEMLNGSYATFSQPHSYNGTVSYDGNLYLNARNAAKGANATAMAQSSINVTLEAYNNRIGRDNSAIDMLNDYPPMVAAIKAEEYVDANPAWTLSSSRATTSVKIRANDILMVHPNSYLAQVVVDGNTYPSGSPAFTQSTLIIPTSTSDRMATIQIWTGDNSVPIPSLASIDTVVEFSYKLLEDITDVKSLSDDSFIMADGIALCFGVGLGVYFQNLLTGFDVRNAQANVMTFFQPIPGMYMAKIGAPWNEDSGTYSTVRVYPSNTMRYAKKQIYAKWFPSSAGSTLNSRKVMFIGDSLTWNGYMLSALMERFSTDSMNIESVGTISTSGNNNGYHHEGRSGWGAYTYTHEASTTSQGGVTFNNAFWNPSTEEFDFSYYVSQNNIIPDYVMICLGTNDYGRSDVAANLKDMIDSIHAYSADIKVGLWMPPVRALYANNLISEFETALQVNKAIVDNFDGQQTSKIYLVPAQYVVDPYHDFPSETASISEYNTNADYISCTDKIHPALSGYKKLADMLYCYIKYFGYLDENA